MLEFELDGESYRADKPDARTQWHVARRLAAAATDAASSLPAEASSGEVFNTAFGHMSDADANFVLDSCLTKVSRRQGTAWAKVTAPGGQLMFDDIDMNKMLALMFKVLEASRIPGFFRIAPSASDGVAAADPLTS